MPTLEDLEVVIATEGSLPNLVHFLRRPEIDRAFVRPLSQRNVSIKERVRSTYQRGFWLIAQHNGNVVGCRGCKGMVDQENAILEFSTTAVAPGFRHIGLATLLLQTAVAIALARYAPRLMRFDSWSTNAMIERVAQKIGFTKTRAYDDPQKRPPGVQSVEYTLDCSRLRVDKEQFMGVFGVAPLPPR